MEAWLAKREKATGLRTSLTLCTKDCEDMLIDSLIHFLHLRYNCHSEHLAIPVTALYSLPELPALRHCSIWEWTIEDAAVNMFLSAQSYGLPAGPLSA
eukprot:6185480-Pleurochrysis_carterae.AAC.2